MRWQTADAGGLFPVTDLYSDDYGSGRMSNLEFLPVVAHKVLNHLPNTPWATWTINAYRGCSHACGYCFARPTHEYLGLNAGSDFDAKIVVKINAVDVLRKELAHPGWRRESVAMGTNTDPYQRAEAKFKLTRGIIAALIAADTPFTILTKSPLVTRDLDLIAPAARRLDITVTFSIATIDEHAWRLSEPGAPHPLRRVEAIRAMADAGVPTGALMAPILPGLSDRPDQLAATARAIEDAGGQVHHAHPVYLRGATREHFMSRLYQHDRELHARYVRGFDAHGDVRPAYRRWLRETLRRAGIGASQPPVQQPREHLQRVARRP